MTLISQLIKRRQRVMLRILAVLVLSISLVGCGGGDDGPEKVTVIGKVTLNGEPLATGDIIFRADGKGQSYAGKINDGSYTLDCEVGSKRVEITSLKEVPGKTSEDNPGEIVNVKEQVVPATYNAETTLTAAVSKDKLEFDFTLEGDPPASK